MSNDALVNFIAEFKAKSDSWDLDEPHCFILIDPETDHVQVHGPYDDGYEAMTAAEAKVAYHDRVIGPPRMLYIVAPIYAPKRDEDGMGPL